MKNLQPIIDFAFVGDDHAKRRARLAALDPQFLQFRRNSESHVIAFQAGVAEQNRICQSALPKEMQLVFTRSKIYRSEVLRGDLAVGRHRKSSNDEWAIADGVASVPRRSGH